MAITPRTILSQPINLLLFALSILALGGVLGVMAGASDSQQRPCPTDIPPDEQASLDAGSSEPDDGEAAGLGHAAAGVEIDPLDYTCRLEEPSSRWTEGQWLRHLGCMEARGESVEVLLDETSDAIGNVGLTPDLAVKKADYLKEVATPDEHIDFLNAAVTRLGVVDGQLVHRLARALTWRGEVDDIERIRHLQLLSRMLMPDSCEVLQTDIWVRYALAEHLAEGPSPAAWHGVSHAINTYLADDCHLGGQWGPNKRGQDERRQDERGQDERGQDERGQWELLTETVGVGIVAEATNGHTGESTLIRRAAESGELRGQHSHVRSFCREAVPANVGLRVDCEKRLGDELFLAR